MIFERQSYSFIFQDAVYSMAVGFITGFINQLLAVFLYKGKIKVFIRDIAVSFIFAILLYSYSVSFANYKVLRWYNVVFALAGHIFFAPCFDSTVRMVLKLAAVSIRRAAIVPVRKIGIKLLNKIKKFTEKRQKFTQKNDENVLKQTDIVLYN